MRQRKQTLSEIVSGRIKSYIAENKYMPGHRLPSEKEMIEMLGVSRTAVREALKSLQSQGIIEIRQGVGIFVKEVHLHGYIKDISPFLKFDKAKFKELVETRIILELGAIELAAQNDEPEKLEQMKEWNQRLLEKARAGGKPKKEDLKIHQLLFEATGNETYMQMAFILTEYFHENQLEELAQEADYITAYEEHNAVITALANREVERAKQAMRQHLSSLHKMFL